MSLTDRPLLDQSVPSRRQSFVIISLYLGIFVLAGLALNGIYTDRSQNRAQAAANQARDEQGAQVSKCLNEFGVDKAMVDQAIRDASSRVTAASTAESYAALRWTTALSKVATYVGNDDSTEAKAAVAEFIEANALLRDAQVESIKAQKNLDKVRAANPIPTPDCDLTDKQ